MTRSSTWRRGRNRILRTLAAALFLFSGAVAAYAESSVGSHETIVILPGPFITGSARAEREAAYLLDENAYGHSITRRNRWYESEGSRRSVDLPFYRIMTNLVTNQQYARFLSDTNRIAPDVSAQTWSGYRLVHPYERTRRHAWLEGKFPAGRAQHPVVLVSHADAEAYAAWLSRKTGLKWRLPSQNEWEKAARGVEGRWFPWGDDFDGKYLNSHDAGPFDTTPVGSFPDGASPSGMLDAAGQVFEWTATLAGDGYWIVKGGSWDDRGCGVCRPAARHARPQALKHILIGFRLVRDEN